MRIYHMFVALLLIPLLGACGGPTELHGAVFQQPRQLDFTLTEVTSGQPLSATDLEGKVVMLFWGYTFCPDICPTTMAEFKQVKDQLGSKADDVRFVMITVDPERDTNDRLARYVASFDPSFIGLRGDVETTKRLTDAYGIVAEKTTVEGTSAGYLIDHTALSFLVDKKGNMRAGYPLGTEIEDIVADVQAVLAE